MLNPTEQLKTIENLPLCPYCSNKPVWIMTGRKVGLECSGLHTHGGCCGNAETVMRDIDQIDEVVKEWADLGVRLLDEKNSIDTVYLVKNKGEWSVVDEAAYNEAKACGRRVHTDVIHPHLYTCIGKGQEYQKIGVGKGAGTFRSVGEVVIYQDTDTKNIYLREPSDFDERMEQLLD